jgi:hypothetical protein
MNISSISATALSNALERVGNVAAAIAGAADPANPADTIDISDAAVALSAAKIDAAVSVRVMRAEQEIMQHALDMFV